MDLGRISFNIKNRTGLGPTHIDQPAMKSKQTKATPHPRLGYEHDGPVKKHKSGFKYYMVYHHIPVAQLTSSTQGLFINKIKYPINVSID